MKKIHPFSAIFFSLSLFIIILIYNNPLYLLSILFFLMGLLIISENKTNMINMLKFGLYTSVFIIIINPIVSGAGKTILYKSPKIALLGRVVISMEGILYGVNMSIKLLCIMLIFTCYSALTNEDDTFTFFSKYAYKLTLTMSMTINILHRLKIEIERIKFVMTQRGVDFEQQNIIKKIKVYYPVLKVILNSSLEGSISRAEALYSRGYGKGRRTSYKNIDMGKKDFKALIWLSILPFLFIIGIILGFGRYEFYPVLDSFEMKETVYLLLTMCYMILFLIQVKGGRMWKYLK